MAPIRRLLVANRGEIAVRVIRAAQEMGITAVVVHSDADEHSLAVELADDAVPIGGAHARDSYLNADALLAAARRAGADAVHPGYGFLSENADFARSVVAAGLTWVGPDADTIARMGHKAQAIATATAAGVPVVWDDREVFVIQQPKPDTVEQVRTFIEGYPGKCGCAEPQYHSHLLLSLTKMVSNFT